MVSFLHRCLDVFIVVFEMLGCRRYRMKNRDLFSTSKTRTTLILIFRRDKRNRENKTANQSKEFEVEVVIESDRLR